MKNTIMEIPGTTVEKTQVTENVHHHTAFKKGSMNSFATGSIYDLLPPHVLSYTGYYIYTFLPFSVDVQGYSLWF